MLAALALLLTAAPDFQRDFIEAGPRAAAIADGQHLRAEPDGSVHLDGPWSVRFSLDSIARGERSCATTFLRREVEGPLLTQHRACGVTETWSTAHQQLEHAFTVASRPPGRGPLRIRLSVDGPWHHRDAHGHLFAGPGGSSALRYGEAFIVRGDRRIPVTVEHHDRSLELIIPADQLDAPHAFPMRIDPVLSTEIDLSLPSPGLTVLPTAPLEPAMVATGLGRTLVAWRDDRFSADGDLFFAEIISGVLQPARPLTVRRGAQHNVALGSVGQRIFVAWEEPDAFGETNVYSCSFALGDDVFRACLVPRLVGKARAPTFDVHGSALAGVLVGDTARIFDVLDGGVRHQIPAVAAERLGIASRAGRTVVALGLGGSPASTQFIDAVDGGTALLSPQMHATQLALAADAGLYAAGLGPANELITVTEGNAPLFGLPVAALAVVPTDDAPDLAELSVTGQALTYGPGFFPVVEQMFSQKLSTLIGVANGSERLLVGTELSAAGGQLHVLNVFGGALGVTPLPLRAPPSSPLGAMNERTAFTVHRVAEDLVWRRFPVSDAGTFDADSTGSNGTFHSPLVVADGFDVALVATRPVVAHFIDPATLVFDSLSAADVSNRTTLVVNASDGRVRLASTGQTLYAMWRSGPTLQFIALQGSELELATPLGQPVATMEEATTFELDCMPNGPCLGGWTLPGGGARVRALDSNTAAQDVGSQTTGGRVMNITHDLTTFWVALGTATEIEFHRLKADGTAIVGGPQYTFGTQATVGATARLEALPGIPPMYFGQSRVEPGTIYGFREGDVMPEPLDLANRPGLNMLSGVMGPITARRVINGAVLFERFVPSPLAQHVLALPFIDGHEALDAGQSDSGVDAGDADAGGVDAGGVDAGPVGVPDAGPGDAGPLVDPRPTQFTSCGCSGAPALVALLLLVFARRRSA